jgi:hypothetical protein
VVRLLKHFPRDQLLFLKSEDLLSRHVDILGQVTDFLDVSPIGQIQKRTDNARPSMVTGLTPLKKDRDFAVRILQQDLDKFSILTGLDVADWPTNS